MELISFEGIGNDCIYGSIQTDFKSQLNRYSQRLAHFKRDRLSILY